MAGDWIPIRFDLMDDPSVVAISFELKMEVYAVAGRLLKLWIWANRHLSKGVVIVPDAWIDMHLDAAGFASAMRNAGWLRTRSSGHLEFPNFERWNSQGAKVRLGETLRKQAYRTKSGKKKPGEKCPGSVPEVSRTLSRTKAGPEKRREEIEEPPIGGSSPPDKPAEENPLDGKPKSAQKPRERNVIFDALAEVTGSDPSIRSVAKTLGVKATELSGADPPYSPDDIREFARRFHELCSWAREEGRQRPTPGELVKWIHLIRAKPIPKPGANGVPFDPFKGGDPMDFSKARAGK